MKSSVIKKTFVDGSIIIDTLFGRLRIWSDKGGLYVDLYEDEDKYKCLAFIDFESHSGLNLSLYEDMKSGKATYKHEFGDLSDAFRRRKRNTNSIWRE